MTNKPYGMWTGTSPGGDGQCLHDDEDSASFPPDIVKVSSNFWVLWGSKAVGNFKPIFYKAQEQSVGYLSSLSFFLIKLYYL